MQTGALAVPDVTKLSRAAAPPGSAMDGRKERADWPLLSRLPMRLTAGIPLTRFKVRDLLALKQGRTLGSAWSSTEDVPLRIGSVQLSWSGFEVVGQRIAVRLTRARISEAHMKGARMKESKMHLVRDWQRVEGAAEAQGLAGFLLGLMRQFTSAEKREQRRHLRVVETLAMAPKRNLYLVSCDGERFLVGTGQDSVQTIVRVRPESAGVPLARGGEQAL